MKIKFCLPIIKNSKEGVLKTIRKNINDFDSFEVWLDHIKDLNNQFMTTLIALLNERLIIVLRRNNSEDMAKNFDRRCQVIRLLHNQSAMLDLDIVLQKKELEYIKDYSVKVSLIVSYHNYKDTLDNRILGRIIRKMDEYKPKIFKIATLCQSENDALRLLGLLLKLKKDGKKCIVLGMGKRGVITRIFGTLWGNEMIYAPNDLNDQSALGQLTKEKLEIIFDILE